MFFGEPFSTPIEHIFTPTFVKKFIYVPVFYAGDRDISRGLLAEGIEPNQEVIIVQIYPHQERFKQACQVLAVIDVTIPVDVQQ